MLFTIKNSVKNRTTLLPFFLLLFCLSLALLTAACGKQEGSAGHLYSFKDAQGTEIKLKEKPKRILTLSMGTDEIMLGLVEPERMLAVQALLDDPKSSTVLPLVKNIPQRITAPTLEQLVAMRPDLIIAPDWGHLENVAAMRDAGLTVAVCKGPRNLAQIKETIELLAKAAGEEERGKKLLALMDKELAEVKAQTEKIPPAERKRVVLISLMGSYGGKGSTFDEACSLANVINARAEIGIKDGQPMTKEQYAIVDRLLMDIMDGKV